MTLHKSTINKRESTFAAYTLKARVQRGKDEPLGAISGTIDLLTLLEEFVRTRQQGIEDDEDQRELRQFGHSQIEERRLCAFVMNGTYGSKGQIYRRGKGKVFDKEVDDADMFRFFVSVYVPAESATGIIVAETRGNGGIMAVFQKDFISFVRERHPDVTLVIVRTMPAGYLSSILGEGNVKSVRFVRYAPSQDEAERLERFKMAQEFGSIEVEIRPKRNAVFSLKEWLVQKITGSANDTGLVEIVGTGWQPDKTLVTLDVNGRSRTIQVETLGIGRPDIVEMLPRSAGDGLPTWDDLVQFSQELTNDLLAVLQTGQ